MENNNTQETSNIWFIYDIDEGDEKRFFISPILETPKEYIEVWKDTQEYKEKKFREYVRDDSPFDEYLYEILRDFNEEMKEVVDAYFSKLAINSKSSAEIQKHNTSINVDDIDICDDDIPF